jgi:hypothetical protein
MLLTRASAQLSAGPEDEQEDDRGREVVRAAEDVARTTGRALLAHLDAAERTALTDLLVRFLQADR